MPSPPVRRTPPCGEEERVRNRSRNFWHPARSTSRRICPPWLSFWLALRAGLSTVDCLSEVEAHQGIACVNSRLLCRQQIAIDKGIPVHHFPDSMGNWFLKYRSGVDEAVELAVFTAGIHIGREAFEKLLIKAAACERFIEHLRIDAANHGFE